MNGQPIKALLIFAVVATGGLVAPPRVLGAPATDIQVFVSNGKLATGLSLYENAFDASTFWTNEPGFAGSPLPQGIQYGVQIAQKLWYHSGIVGDPVTPVRGDVFVTVSDATSSLIITGSSGLQTGLILDESLAGSLHGHLDYELFPTSGSPAPAGVYGLVLQMSSSSLQASDEFVLAIVNDAEGVLTLPGMEYGAEAIRNAAVPEPSSVVLAGLGVAGLAVAAVRRRMRKQSSTAPRV